MVDRFVSYATGHSHRAGEPGAVIRRDREQNVEMVNMLWGFAAAEPGGRPFTLVRSEGRHFGRRRCLIPAGEFYVSSGHGDWRRRFRVTLRGGDHFYFAGIWRPTQGDWPSSYAILTTQANPDIFPYHDRQMAVVLRERRFDWLDHMEPEEEMLKPLRRGTFAIEQTAGPRGKRSIFEWEAGQEPPALAAAANLCPACGMETVDPITCFDAAFGGSNLKLTGWNRSAVRGAWIAAASAARTSASPGSSCASTSRLRTSCRCHRRESG